MKLKNKIISSLMAVALSVSLIGNTGYAYEFVENPDMSDWIVWESPNEDLIKGTAIDVSDFLEKPAGKHGFVHAEGDDIYFADGTKARFWGTNILAGSDIVFGNKVDIEKIVKSAARRGYNLIRMHLLDRAGASNIFGHQYGSSTSAVIDEDQLDKMFYAIHLMKENGIYIYMDMWGIREIFEGDIPGETGFSNAYTSKSAGIKHWISPEYIQYQKDYAKKLFTTVNPYTGLKLADDPVVVMMQLNNEASLFGNMKKSNFSATDVANIINPKFNAYLKNKYGSTSSLTSAWKQSSRTGVASGESLEDGTVDFNKVFLSDGSFDYNYSSQSTTTISVNRAKDSRRFIYEYISETYAELYNYLKNDLGVKCLITGTSRGGSATSNASMYAVAENTDFMDMHEYWGHPTDTGFGNNNTYQGISTSISTDYLWSTLAKFNMKGKPHVIGEYNNAVPLAWGGETEPIGAILASRENWFPLNYSLKGNTNMSNKLSDPFESYSSAVRTAVQPASSLIYLRGDIAQNTEKVEIPFTKEQTINGGYMVANNWVHLYATPVYTLYTDSEYEAFEKKSGWFGWGSSEKDKLEDKIDDYVKSGTKLSNQLTWDRTEGSAYVSLNTDYSNVFTGEIQGKTFESNALKITDINNASATFTYVSLDNSTLLTSPRLLLSAVGREANTGLTWNGSVMTNTGTAPLLAEPVSANITIKSTTPIDVWALNPQGQRKMRVSLTKTSDGYYFAAGKDYQTLYYEVVRTDSVSLLAQSDSVNREATIFGYAGSSNANKDVAITISKNGSVASGNTKTLADGTYSLVLAMPATATAGDYQVSATGNGISASAQMYYAGSKTIYEPVRNNYSSMVDLDSGVGCLIVDSAGANSVYVQNAMPQDGAGNAVTTVKASDGLTINFNNTAYSYEWSSKIYNLTEHSKNFAYLRFDILGSISSESDLVLTVADKHAKNGKSIKLNISDYVSLSNSWQTVTIPFADIPSEYGFTTDSDEYVIGLGLSNRGTASIKVRNMYTGLWTPDKGDYYYDRDKAIELVNNGAVASGVTALADKNSSTITLNEVQNDVPCVKISFAGEGKAVKFGSESKKLFSNVNSADYLLVAKVKLSAAPNRLALIKTNEKLSSNNDGNVSNIGRIGQYFKNTTNWQTVFIPLSEITTDISSSDGIGFTVDTATGSASSAVPVMYINYLSVVPKTAERYNAVPAEKIMNDEMVLYRQGKAGVNSGIKVLSSVYSLSSNDQRRFIDGTIKIYGESSNDMVCFFDLKTLGINNSNYKNKYLKFDVFCNNGTKYPIYVGRSKTNVLTDTVKGLRERVRINCEKNYNWRTFVVPLSAISQLDSFSWGEPVKNGDDRCANYLYIHFEPNTWYTSFYLDNISIGSFEEGEAAFMLTEIANDDDNTAIVVYDAKNTMSSSYERGEENIIVAEKEGVGFGDYTLRDIHKVEGIPSVIPPNTDGFGESNEIYFEDATPGKRIKLETFRWDVDSFSPLQDKISIFAY